MDSFSFAKNILGNAQTIAVAPGEDFHGDAFAASLALFSILRKLGKETTFLAQEIPPKLRFLHDELIARPQETLLAINVQGRKLNQLRYEKSGDRLKIYLSLEEGSLKQSDLVLSPAQSFSFQPILTKAPDVFVTVGVSRLDALEKKLPSFNGSSATILNIDNTADNERFGSLNLIDSKTPSLSELLGDFIFSAHEDIIDQRIATILLAGLLLGSQNFRHPKTGPKTFERVALLLEKGADHQLVVKHLYKTKSAAQLRLLGRALESLELKEDGNIAITLLSQADFHATETSSKDLAFVFEELKTNFWQSTSLLLLWESHGSGPLVKGIFSSKDKGLLRKLLDKVEGVYREETALFLVRESALEKAKEKLLNVLSISPW